jgi:chemotaxis protein MotB
VRKKKPPEHVNHERWLVSYADFITLLFAFFTTMYAISTVDVQKMGKMVTSVRASFDAGIFNSGSTALALLPGSGAASGKLRTDDLIENVVGPKEGQLRDKAMQSLRELKANLMPAAEKAGASGGPEGAAKAGKSLGDLKRQIEALVGSEAMRGKVHTRLDPRGLIVSLGEVGFFDSGSDQIKPEGVSLLDTIATSFVGLDNHIRVEGHTDNVPIKSNRFPSNWELSTARATNIVAHLITSVGLPPGRLSAAGYAEFRPIVANDSADGRARNRRVDIIVLDPQFARTEEPR